MQENRLITVKGVTFNLIKVEGGTFMMGDTDDTCRDNEKPAHLVTISTFYIGETQVTQGLWKAVTNKNPSFFKNGDDYPVELVSYNRCLEFIQKLNSLTGLVFRLPTEAEWEFAARGGNQSKGYKYSGGDDIDSVAWYALNSDNSTNPVAQKRPNELGIYDMTGNVWEWCQDRYDSYPSEPQNNPQGNNTRSSQRVMRGASWSSEPTDCRLTNRCGFTPSLSTINCGLRLALNPTISIP